MGIASVLIFVVHAERLPEGKKYCIIMFADCVRLHIVAAMLNLATVNLLIVVCSQVLYSSLGLKQSVKNIL